MASGDTKTEALLRILGHGGSVDGITGSGNTKTQDYLVDAIGRLQGIEDEVEEIKNNPDVVDIVDTYADLQAYDTQHLSDNDVIRVLQDETHDGNSTYYRFSKNAGTWTFIGEIAGGSGIEYVDLTLAGVSQQGFAVTASKYMDEVLDLAEDDKKVIFRITLPFGTGYPTSGTYELPLFNYEDNEKALAMTVVALGGTLYSIIFGYDLSGIVGDHTNVGNISIDVLPTGSSGSTEIMYLAYYPGEDPAAPGESCLYADAGLTTKLTGGDFWNILSSGNPVALRYRDTSYNEFYTFSFLSSHLPAENTIAGFDSYAPDAYFYSSPNQTVHISFLAGDPDETDGFSIGV